MTLYRFLFLSLAAPVFAALMAWRLLRGRETPEDVRQRLGGGGAPIAGGPVIWLHAASVGETVAARSLAEALLARDPRLRLVMTANTVTGRARAAGWAHSRIAARLAPVDTRWAAARFLADWQPAALVTVENELWPNRMAAARARRLPVLVAGARLSARSFAIWRRAPKTAKAVLALIDHAAPQDVGTAERLADLGLPAGRIGPELNLKAAVRSDAVEDAVLAPFAAALPYPETVLAASTHPGEEGPVLAAFAEARKQNRHLRLILAPRHPERGDEVAGKIAAAGLGHARRSKGEMPGEAPVYLADTLGEMALWYNLAAVTFVGGSLAEKGGHTPFEPAQAMSAILHGPSVENFAASYAALDAARGARQVADGPALAAAMTELSRDHLAREAMVARASEALARMGSGSGALDAFVTRLGELTGNPALTEVRR